MPFGSLSAMDSRRVLVESVVGCGMSLSEACRLAGVTRKTGRKWVVRAAEQGIENLSELSRAPRSVYGRTSDEVQEVLVRYRSLYPEWGARKLVVLMERDLGVILPSRTAEHILKRLGMTKAVAKSVEPVRFERDSCGALLQMDFKGLPQGLPYALLSVLDDHGRFCLRFEPVADKSNLSVRPALWDMFGEHGLPESMLMDNGDCWDFVNRYNWVRPHDALAMATPGSRYTPFARKRPERLPEHEIPSGAVSRKVDANGMISCYGKVYRIGKGLIGERVVLQDEGLGTMLYFANYPLCHLEEL